MSKGKVILVGAGPGDPDLLTEAAVRELSRAEVVVYDRLVSDDILAQRPAAAEKINVGKNVGDHPGPQHEINRILLIGGGAKSVAIRTLAPSILGMDVTRPATDEYVAIGAARQAAWVLSGEAEPPTWQLTIEGVETGEPTEAVYEAYAKARG